jgi:hypothetical protein
MLTSLLFSNQTKIQDTFRVMGNIGHNNAGKYLMLNFLEQKYDDLLNKYVLLFYV